MLLLLLLAWAAVATAQSSGQYLITLMDGRSVVRMLPPDWTPRFNKAFLYFTPRDRVFVADIAAVQPVHPDDIRGQHVVKLLFRNQLGRGSGTFWVPDRFRTLEEVPRQEGFLLIGPQTLIREGIYREVLE